MRATACVFTLGLVLAGCGAVDERRGGGPASTSQTPETGSLPVDEAEEQKPPPIVLESAAGRQEAVLGTYCVSYLDEAAGIASGVCADAPWIPPERLNTVRPGEEIRILLEGADVVRPQEGSAVFHPLGCEKKSVAEIPLVPGPAIRWRVELEPGAYALDIFVMFEGEKKSGDVSGALGLLVDETGPLKVVPVPAAGGGCDQSQSSR
jgi:hypothetical protein